MKKIIKNFTLLMVLLFDAFGCKMANNITYVNLAPLYEAEKKPEITGIRIFNENDSVTTTFVRYKIANLLYQQEPGMTFRKANYSIAFRLFPSYESNKILDSATYFLSDSLNFGKNTALIFDFSSKVKYPGNYLLEVELTDLNAGKSTLLPLNIDKSSKSSAQNFLPVDNNNAVIFENWIGGATNFRIITNNDSINELLVSYYNRNFSISLPPFSAANQETYEYEADDIYTLKTSNRRSELLNFPNHGFYHFQADSSARNGFTFFRFFERFPNVNESEQLIPPLRYLTSNMEFKQLLMSADMKMAADSFWFVTAGSHERALEISKEYYSRVELANRFFTSFKEGWKTDRGMIYIIFGQPKTVYRRDDIETWVYGERGNRVSLTFDFIKAINPFTSEDFVLQRRADYKNPWFIAIDYWRR